jgi:hypothetical protein
MVILFEIKTLFFCRASSRNAKGIEDIGILALFLNDFNGFHYPLTLS